MLTGATAYLEHAASGGKYRFQSLKNRLTVTVAGRRVRSTPFRQIRITHGVQTIAAARVVSPELIFIKPEDFFQLACKFAGEKEQCEELGEQTTEVVTGCYPKPGSFNSPYPIERPTICYKEFRTDGVRCRSEAFDKIKEIDEAIEEGNEVPQDDIKNCDKIDC